MTSLTHLGFDAITNILSFIGPLDLVRFGGVNRSLRHWAQHPRVWGRFMSGPDPSFSRFRSDILSRSPEVMFCHDSDFVLVLSKMKFSLQKKYVVLSQLNNSQAILELLAFGTLTIWDVQR